MPILKYIKTIFKKSFDYIATTNRKEWSKRQYKFYLIFGDVQENKVPWMQTEWNYIYEPLFNQLVQLSPDFKNTGIRVLEYKKDDARDYYSELKLGRLRWDKKSHQKWTIQVNNEIQFHHFESWTPIWTTCEKTSSPPDIFISIQNEEDSKQRFSKLQFNVFVVIAVAEDLQVVCNPIVVEISKRIKAKRAICQTRYWSKAKTDRNRNWTFNNWIQDTWSNGIYNSQSLHGFNFADIKFEPYWETIYKPEK